MTFSLIIPTYNEQDFIGRCLQSILHQSYPRSEFEIIVADSHSSDGTAEVAARWADKILTIPRRGIAHARNAGAREAVGEILVFVDADVTLQPDFLSRLQHAFADEDNQTKDSSRSDATFGRVRTVAVTGHAIPADGTWFPRFVYRATYALVGLFTAVGLPLFPGLCVAYRKHAFDTVGGFREDFGISEDLDLSKRISKLGKCIYDKRARAFVSTRRLQRHALSTVLFHIYHDLRYLLFGKTARHYPKSEELHSAADLWRMNRTG
jgi:glycosyltransferase involved in cell wall biosynthesis